jgi:protein-tyrosine phosphatase
MVDWSWIVPGKLAQGAAPDGEEDLGAAFDVVVLCAKEWQPASVAFEADVVRVPLRDLDPPEPGTFERAGRAADYVALQLRAGKRVLVTCAMGLNRSGLVAALALAKAAGKPTGLCGRYVKLRRPGALYNKAFARFLGIP